MNGIAARIAAPLLVALLVAILMLRGGIPAGAALAGAALLAYLVIASGRLLARAAGAPELGPAAAYVLGLIATCLAVYALTVACAISAMAAFGILVPMVLGLELVYHRRGPEPHTEGPALIGFALCVLFTAAWCYGPAGAYETLRTQDVLPVWSDYFFHGGLLSQFADLRALGRGSIYLADHPSSFYHFASYADAAALAGLLNLPGLPLATGAWLPLGFLAMLAGAHTLGTRLGGAAGGVAALAALAILPDASNYGLRNGWFSFHFTLMAHPGGTYALGGAFLSLALLDRWSDERSRATLAASALLALSLLLFRAHVFLLYLPAWIAAAAFCAAPAGSRRRLGWVLVAGLGSAAAASGVLLAHLAQSGAGYWRFGEPAMGRFFTIVHEWQEPTAYTGLYADLAEFWPPFVALAGGVSLAVLAALGAIVILLPAAATLAGRARVLRPIDSACMYLLFCWLLLMLYAPTPWHGEASDLIHRPFVLVYAAGAIWTLCLPLRVLNARAGGGRTARQALLAGAILALPATFAAAEKMSRPKFAWGEREAAVHVPAGLVQAADFMRARAARGDIFAAAGLGSGYATFDLATQLCALTGMPSYLSRPYLEMIKDAPRKEVAAARLAALQRVDALPDYRSAMQALRALNIQWYVSASDRAPRWDRDGRHAAFRSATVSLYAIALDGPDLRSDER